MSFKFNITAKFFLPIIILFLSLIVVLSFFVSNIVEQSLIERAKNFIVDHAHVHASHLLTIDDFSSANYENSEQDFVNFLNAVKTPEILRIKVWNNESKVIWSDDKNIIGKEFKDNEEYNEAMEGKIAAEIQKPVKKENVGEVGYKQLLEVYAPVNFSKNSKPDGVIEIYYKMDSVNEMVVNSRYKIAAIILGGVFILFIFLWYFFQTVIKTPLIKLIKASDEIAKGNFSKKMDVRSKDEIGNLAASFNKMAEEIEQKQQELEATNSKLEQRVKERVGPYEDKIKELGDKVFDLEKTKNNLEDKLKNYV